MKVTYEGPQEGVVILSTGQTVARGETVEVPADVGRQLVAQGWTKPTPAKKAAKKPTKSEED